MNNSLTSIGIVLPCFNEEEILLQTDKKIVELLGNLIHKKLVTEKSLIVYVDDGSSDKTWEIIQNIVNNNKCRMGVKFSRNFGHQTALLGGITCVYQQVD